MVTYCKNTTQLAKWKLCLEQREDTIEARNASQRAEAVQQRWCESPSVVGAPSSAEPSSKSIKRNPSSPYTTMVESSPVELDDEPDAEMNQAP